MPNFRNNVSFYSRENNCGCDQRTDRRMDDCSPGRMRGHMDDRMMDQRRDPCSGMPLAMAYVPWQRWQNLYDAEKGFHCGTIFQDLRKPFEHAGGGCR